MLRHLAVFWGAGVLLGLTFATQALAIDPEGAQERDLSVKESVDQSNSRDRSEIGEVERENDHNFAAEREDRDRDLTFEREDHEALHEDRETESAAHDSISAETHDSGGASHGD